MISVRTPLVQIFLIRFIYCMSYLTQALTQYLTVGFSKIVSVKVP